MKKMLLFVLILGCGVMCGYAQKQIYNDNSIKTVELYSVYDANSNFLQQNYHKGCFNLIAGDTSCDFKSSLIQYGLMRVSDDWDWLQIGMPVTAQTRMIGLGKKSWEDALELPAIKPWVKLGPGENRSVTIDASGANGKRGENGRNGENGRDGESGGAGTEVVHGQDKVNDHSNNNTLPVVDPLPSTSDLSNKPRPVSTVDKKTGYNPFEKAIEGNMYLVRVVDAANDYYILFRVDKLERGAKCVISWRKVNAPADEERVK